MYAMDSAGDACVGGAVRAAGPVLDYVDPGGGDRSDFEVEVGGEGSAGFQAVVSAKG
jgi:hypothetical protein